MPALFKLKTKKENEIDVFGKIQGSPPEDQSKFRKELIRQLGARNERTLPNESYNCHGFTFVSKAGHIGTGTLERKLSLPDDPDFINTGFDQDLVEKDILTLIADHDLKLKASTANLHIDKFYSMQNIVPGDIVIYRTFENQRKLITHSGIVYKVTNGNNRDGTVNIKILSKIGTEHGEFFHMINNQYIINMYGIIGEIWTDAKL